jgi:hypothetical protein
MNASSTCTAASAAFRLAMSAASSACPVYETGPVHTMCGAFFAGDAGCAA